MSCDDTKLHPALRTYWDPEKEMYFLVGAVEGQLAVANPEELRAVLATLKDPKNKACKVCLLTLQMIVFSG